MPSEIEGLIFPYFFAKNRIFGCLGGILEVSWAVLAKYWGRLGPPRRLQDALKQPESAPRASPEASRRCPRSVWGFSCDQEAPKSCPEPSRPRFWCLRTWILEFFSRILARFLVDLIHMFYHFSKFAATF